MADTYRSLSISPTISGDTAAERFVYRRMERGDIDVVMDINHSSMLERYPRESFERILRIWPTACIVSQRGPEIAGYVLCVPARSWTDEQETVGRIYSIAIRDSFRRKGVAQRLMSLARARISFLLAPALAPPRLLHPPTRPPVPPIDDAIRKLGYAACTLHVRKSNLAAQNMYVKLGYGAVGVCGAYYGTEDGIMMSISLSGAH